ncbi:hypothetical protein [Paraburkholderia acidicola]|uniref:hypothetical protein n=1 Tax=Paraburkholderia acidicola TaxID=1912599 RepID=UPI001A96F5B8|nr:hypothetical protein [Paraburkholderia acidicola]
MPAEHNNMTAPERPDHEAQCDLLCHLVVRQLVEHAASHTWLRTVHVAESIRLWHGAHRTHTTRLDQVRLARMAATLAAVFEKQQTYRNAVLLAELSFDIWRLNFRSPLLHTIRAACAKRLTHTAAATRSTVEDGLEAHALTLTVLVIRKAQGKKNPHEVSVRSPEWHAINQDFLRDVLLAQRSPLDTGADGAA